LGISLERRIISGLVPTIVTTFSFFKVLAPDVLLES